MKKALCLVILLAGAAVGYAASGINIYITAEDDPSGLGQVMSNDQLPGERFDQTEQNFVPFFTSPGATLLNHGNSPLGTGSAVPFVQDIGTTKTYYLWADLTEDPNATGANRVARLGIYGLDLSGVYAVSTNAIGQSTEYRQMDDAGNTRWTTVAEVPCFNGLQSLGNGVMSFVSTDLQYTTGTGVAGRTAHALLGAFEFIANQPGDGLFLNLGSIFAAVREYKRTGTSTYSILHDYDTAAGGYYPRMFVNGAPYAFGAGTPQLAITVTPEPASMLLLGLAGLLIRRR